MLVHILVIILVISSDGNAMTNWLRNCCFNHKLMYQMHQPHLGLRTAGCGVSATAPFFLSLCYLPNHGVVVGKIPANDVDPFCRLIPRMFLWILWGKYMVFNWYHKEFWMTSLWVLYYGFTVVYPKNGTCAKFSWLLFMVGSPRSWIHGPAPSWAPW